MTTFELEAARPDTAHAMTRELLAWRKPFKKVLNWKLPHAKWFEDGKLNVSENCLDRHLEHCLDRYFESNLQ